jgi:hypothetical protein
MVTSAIKMVSRFCVIPRINLRSHSNRIASAIKAILIHLSGADSSLKTYRSDSLSSIATLNKFYLYLVFLECMAKEPRIEEMYIKCFKFNLRGSVSL